MIVAAIVLIGFGAILTSAIALSIHFIHSWTNVFLTILAGLVSIGIYARHIQITQTRRSRNWPKASSCSNNSSQATDQEYYLFVLGSGGHTKEMLMMMDDGHRSFPKSHRRYLISSGDNMSENHLEDYEAELRSISKSPGTYDKRIVTRARRVHQPLWSTPFTGLQSILDIFPVLLFPPQNEAGKVLRYPTTIFSNGPATGFFVALAVYMLKLASVVPAESMKFVYIESWARITSLSLTGKLLYYLGLVDVFYVQHAEVAARYGLVNAGEMVFNSRQSES